MDFQEVSNFASNSLSIIDSPRMPWHDVNLAFYHHHMTQRKLIMNEKVHMTFTGPVVLDTVQHFVERWNEIKKRKVSFIATLQELHCDSTFSTVPQ